MQHETATLSKDKIVFITSVRRMEQWNGQYLLFLRLVDGDSKSQCLETTSVRQTMYRNAPAAVTLGLCRACKDTHDSLSHRVFILDESSSNSEK